MRKLGCVSVLMVAILFAGLKPSPTLNAAEKGLVVNYGFEPGESEDWVLQGAEITNDKKEVITGKGSLKADTLESSGDWNEFLHSDPSNLPLEPKGTYTIYFKYKVLDKKEGGRFYFLVRSKTGGVGPADKAFTYIDDAPGTTASKTITLTLDDFDDYYLIIGIYKQGVIVIDDVKVFKGKVEIKELSEADPKQESERNVAGGVAVKSEEKKEIVAELGTGEWHQLYVPGDGYWRKRVGIDVINESKQEFPGEPVQLKIGKKKGEIDLAGAEARELRVCDNKGSEFLFNVIDARGVQLKEEKISEGAQLIFPVEIGASSMKRYYVYYDNPSAWAVPDFFEGATGVFNTGFEENVWWDWQNAQRVTDKYFSGKASAKLTASENNASGPYTPLISIPEHSSFSCTVSFYYNVEITDGRYFVSIYHYDKNGKSVPRAPAAKEGHSDIFSINASSGGWKKFTITVGQKGSGAKFILPEGTAKIKIRGCFWDADNSNTGIAYLDDFALEGLEKISSPLKLVINPSEEMKMKVEGESAKWLAQPGLNFDCRVPAQIINPAKQPLKNILAVAGLTKIITQMRGLDQYSISLADASGKTIPCFNFSDNLLFSADIPASTINTYYVYLTSGQKAKTPGGAGYKELISSGANLVENPDFEEGDNLPRLWRSELETAQQDGKVEYGKDPNVKYEKYSPGKFGNYCAMMSVSPQAPIGWRGWRQEVTAKPNATYFYAAYLKTEAITDGDVRIHGHFHDKDGKLCGNKYFSAGAGLKGTNDWTLLSGTLQMPPDVASVELHLTMNARGTVYHDGILFCEIAQTTLKNREYDTSKYGKDLAVWDVNPIVKVFQDDQPKDTPKEFQISAARNEKEPLQIVLWNAKDIKSVKVTVDAPANEKQEKLTDFKIERVGFVPIDRSTNYYSAEASNAKRYIPGKHSYSDGWEGWWPDPLLPGKPFDLPAGVVTPLWITFSIPKDAKAGDYLGKVNVEYAGKTKTIPLRVTVWNFELSDEPHLTALFDLRHGPGWNFLNSDTRKEWYKFMAERRVCADHIEPSPIIKYEKGQATMNFEEFDRMAKYYFDDLKMKTAYMPSFFYCFGWGFKPRTIFGTEYPSAEYKQAYQACLKAFWDHIKEKGWDKKFILYISDEPHFDDKEIGKRLTEQMQWLCNMIHEVSPDIKIYSSTWRHCPEWDESLDVWGVGAYGCFPVETMEKLLSKGKTIWWTTDGQFCTTTPYLAIERIYPYYCWKYGSSAYEFWGISWWTYDPFKFGWHAYLPHTFTEGGKMTMVRYPSGDGYFTYPGWLIGETGPLSSIRLEQVREGMEDYEYMYILKQRIDEAKKKGKNVDSALKALEKVNELVTIPNASGTRSTKILPDPDVIFTIRNGLAQEILKLEN